MTASASPTEYLWASGNGEAVGDGRLAVGVPEAVALGLADGCRARCDEGEDEERDDWLTAEHVTAFQREIHPPSGSMFGSPPASAAGHELIGRPARGHPVRVRC